jgi:hypothetical protein
MEKEGLTGHGQLTQRSKVCCLKNDAEAIADRLLVAVGHMTCARVL